MRILMLAQFYPPIIGGEERLVHDLSAGLARRGHEVSVVTLLQTGLPERETADGVRIHRVRGLTQRVRRLHADPDRRMATPFPDPEVAGRLARIVARERPQVLHGHNWMIHSCLPLKRWSGAALVWTLGDHSLVCATKKLIHASGANCPGPGPVRCLRCASAHYGALKGVPTALADMAMAAASRRMVDRFLPVSSSVAELCGLAAAGVPFEVVPNFVPDAAGEPGPAGERLPAPLPEGDFILFVGALGRHKGVDVLLDAYARLGEDRPPLVLIGYDTNEHPMRTRELPPGARILRNWDHGAVMAAWRRAAIGLVPSVWHEPFGIVALEAMAAATPVIASRIGGLVDVVDDGRTGLLVPPGDAAALAAAMRRLTGAPDERRRMGAAGRERVARFRESAAIPRFERVYAEVAA